MYLSRLIVNTRNPRGLRSLVDPYEAHRTIWRGFPDAAGGGPGRVLFRLEQRANPPRLEALVQSIRRPDWQTLVHEDVLLRADSKEVRLDALRNGLVLRFKLRANPTKKIADTNRTRADGSPRPIRVGLCGEEQQVRWLQGKADLGGFRLIECRISARDKTDSRKARIEGNITHAAVVFEGMLQVTDADVFHSTLENGIGSAKGFGFGLLSVAPVRR